MEIVLDPEPYDVLAVELSSHQLHWSHSLALHSAAVLNLQPDHLEWHGSFEAYGAAKASIYERVSTSCVYNVRTRPPRRWSSRPTWSRAPAPSASPSGTPAPSMLGVVDDLLVDRAFIEQRRDSALELAKLADISPLAPHNVANALAAAALARSFGVLAAGRPRRPAQRHASARTRSRPSPSATGSAGSTTPRPPTRTPPTRPCAPSAPPPDDPAGKVVWIAGGQAKGTSFDDLVAAHAGRLRAVVLLGVDREVIAGALARHAPDVPVQVIDATDTGAMVQAVAAAASSARPGDTVLLAPGCASLDMYTDYAARGDAFVRAIRDLTSGSGGTGGTA